MVRDFAEKEIAPFIREWDEKSHFEPAVLRKMGEMGILGISIPEKYGGGGMDYNSLAIVCEELERVDTSFRVVLSVHTALNSMALLQWGTPEQKMRWLFPQAKGERIAAFALTEPEAGTDVTGIKMTAYQDDDYWVLNGEKNWVSLAEIAQNFLVFAYTDAGRKHRGMTAFLVSREQEGFESYAIQGRMGIRAGNIGGIRLKNLRVHRDDILGMPGEGFKIAMSALDNGRFTAAAGAVGLIEACLEAGSKYARERHIQGKPIGEFQLIQAMIARIYAGAESSRLLVFQCGWEKNQGLRTTRSTSLCKWFACERAVEAANDAVQIFGARGYSNEFPVERYLRNARGLQIYEGTREIHQLIQGQYALGWRKNVPLRCELPQWPFED